MAVRTTCAVEVPAAPLTVTEKFEAVQLRGSGKPVSQKPPPLMPVEPPLGSALSTLVIEGGKRRFADQTWFGAGVSAI